MTRLEKKPFALLGVNVFHDDAKALREVMKKENLPWRSFAGRGDVARQWNSPATPTMYVIDHRGVIRHRWIGHPGREVIDAALKRRIDEASSPEPEPERESPERESPERVQP